MASVLRQLGPSDAASAFKTCVRLGPNASFVGGWIAEGGLVKDSRVPRAWLYREREGGLVYVSDTGIIVPHLNSQEGRAALADLAARDRRWFRVIIGERSQVEYLWTELESTGLKSRRIRDQLALSVDKKSFKEPEAILPLQPPPAHLLEQLVEASAAMAREEAQDDPYNRNPNLFRARIRERISRGKDFVSMDLGRLRFKANVATISKIGGQIEGIYTVPAFRRQGLGLAGTAWLTQWILERGEKASLLVNADNQAALHLYEKLGFAPFQWNRTLFVDAQ